MQTQPTLKKQIFLKLTIFSILKNTLILMKMIIFFWNKGNFALDTFLNFAYFIGHLTFEISA